MWYYRNELFLSENNYLIYHMKCSEITMNGEANEKIEVKEYQTNSQHDTSTGIAFIFSIIRFDFVTYRHEISYFTYMDKLKC